jgi:hypothetical protein
MAPSLSRGAWKEVAVRRSYGHHAISKHLLEGTCSATIIMSGAPEDCLNELSGPRMRVRRPPNTARSIVIAPTRFRRPHWRGNHRHRASHEPRGTAVDHRDHHRTASVRNARRT